MFGASNSDPTSLDLINHCDQKQYVQACISDTAKQITAPEIYQLFYRERAPLILSLSLSATWVLQPDSEMNDKGTESETAVASEFYTVSANIMMGSSTSC